MDYDFNDLEISADLHMKNGAYKNALALYFFMADGDPSLDAGHLAERIAACYHALGEPHAAKYWYGRALEENPEVYSHCSEQMKKLGDMKIDAFLLPGCEDNHNSVDG